MWSGSPLGAGSPPWMLRRGSGLSVTGAAVIPVDRTGMFVVGIGSNGPCWGGDVGAGNGLVGIASAGNVGDTGSGRGVAPCCGSTTSELGGVVITCACIAGGAVIASPPTIPPANMVRPAR
jgi:hypothetical protein